MKSGAINIDRYTGVEPEQKFNFLYENFSILQELLDDYREDIIAEVIEQKAYNRRTQSGDLGVRIQVSMGIGNPTMNHAIEHMTIAQAIDKGLLDEEFFEDTDNRQELIRKVSCYHRVNTDLEIFTSKLRTMNLKDQNIIRPYLLREKSIDDLAVDLGIDYRSAVKHVYRIKKRLIEKVEPKLTIMNRRGA